MSEQQQGSSAGLALAGAAARAAGTGAMVKVGAVVAVLVFAGVILIGLLGGGAPSGFHWAGSGGADTCSGTMPQTGGGELTDEQEQIARIANDVATDMNMPGQAVLIIFMAGLQESQMRNLDYGDRDSLGWLQQRPSQGWGTPEQVMDPAHAARMFYDALRRVAGWVDMPYWQAADAVQRSAYPTYYAKHEQRARDIAATIGADLDRPGEPYVQGPPVPRDDDPGLDLDVGDLWPERCDPDLDGLVVSAEGWTHPAPGMTRLTSRFGEVRTGYSHMGDDLAAPADSPILAAADGVVTHVSCLPWRGRSQCNIQIGHGTDAATGQTVETLYVHMFPDGVLVDRGDQVAAGDVIGRVGNNGNSFGYHLHLEVWLDGVEVAPVPFFADRGVDLSRPPAPGPQAAG